MATEIQTGGAPDFEIEAGCVKIAPMPERTMLLDPAHAVRIANALLIAAARAEGERRFFADRQQREISKRRAVYR